jgi:hypothetical protein
MPQKKIKQVKTSNHTFRGCREGLLVPHSGAPGTAIGSITSNASGNGNTAFVLAPVGLTAATFASGVYTNGTTCNISAPPLRGLFNKAVDFQMYRVTRAKLIFVSNQGTTCIGRITLAAYTDPLDASSITYDSYVSGPNTKKFDVSSAATRDVSIPVPVDSSWKKVSSILTVPGNVYPFNGADATSAVTVNTVGDLCFGAISVNLSGFGVGTSVSANSNVGTFMLEYDVEFKGVIDSAVNN